VSDKDFVVKHGLVVNDTAIISGIEIDPSGASSNQVLKFNGAKFIPGTVSGGATVSDTPPASPTTGQLWFESDTAQTFVFYDSQWIEVGAAPGVASVSDAAPGSPATGQLWFDSNSGATNVFYDSQWVEIGGGGTVATVSDTAPAGPALGQIWFNSTDGGTYVYYDGVWAEIGAVPPGSTHTVIDAKGDLLVGIANDTLDRLAVGTNGYFLKANSSTTTGLSWSAIPTINTLDDIGDVTITSAANGEFLKWNGSAWVNATVSSDVMTDARNAAIILMDIGA